MDFFSQQEESRRGTRLLVGLFLLALVALVITTDLTMVALFPPFFTEYARGQAGPGRQLTDHYAFFFRHPHWVRLGQLSFAVAWFILLVSFFKIRELARGGGKALARHLGARVITRDSVEPRERVLLNVVEEMSLASGVPCPEIFLLPKEDGINAFAAGFTVDESVITVTQGTLDKLKRDELQGVIAHEFSHLLNGDMLLNMRMIGVLHGILFIAIVGKALRELGSSGKRVAGAPLAAGLLLTLIGQGGYLLGLFIQSAVSRQREFLADASAVQFTRNPMGIGGALRKIAVDTQGSRVRTALAHGMRHMFFARSFSSFWQQIFRTHPSVSARLTALGMPLQPDEARAEAQAEKNAAISAILKSTPEAAAFMTPPTPRAPVAPASAPPAPTPGDVLGSVGTVPLASLAAAQSFMQSVPALIREATRDPAGATCLVYASLLDLNPKVRLRQLELLRGATQPSELERIETLAGLLGQINPSHVTPLFGMAFPSLRLLSATQRERLLDRTRALAEADDQITPFEYMLTSLLRRRLATAAPAKPALQSRAMLATAYWKNQLGTLLAAVASAGGESAVESRASLACGWGALQLPPPAPELTPEWNFAAFDGALQALAGAPYKIRKTALDACARCAAKDGKLTHNELDLIRAIADILACPMPFPA